jgi:hypothetical protein
MRKLRLLADGVWYEVRTSVNNREPLFWVARERARFEQVLNEAREIYVFELRGLRFDGAWVSFYIKPADGFELPVIMQWVKQTYAVRYNVYDGRTGHIWGDRYWSEILPGNPPEDAEEYVFLPVVCAAGGNAAARRTVRRGARRADPGRDGGRHKTSAGTRRTAVTAGRGLPYGRDWRGGVCPIRSRPRAQGRPRPPQSADPIPQPSGHPPQVRAIPG